MSGLMLKRNRIFILPALLFYLLAGTGRAGGVKMNPNFDHSSVNEFWAIMDLLIDNREPTEKQWMRLFNSTGFNTLRREFKDEFFKRYFRAAYMPGQSQVRKRMLEKAEKATGWFARWFPGTELEALEWTRKNRKLIEAEVRSFDSFPYTSLATAEAMKFLPEDQPESWPQVAFVIFNDSRGYDPVVMSFNILSRQKVELPGHLKKKLMDAGHNENWPRVLYFAHEFFHYFRSLKQEFRYPDENDPDYILVWLLDQIENEGIADQINVRQLYLDDGPLAGSGLAEKELKDREGAADEISRLNVLLSEIYRNPERTVELAKQARKAITRSGHVAGFYMSSLILNRFSPAELAKIARNPFRFFFLYQKVAQNQGRVPLFSEQALSLIRNLEEKYVL
jgi:hypothetical protein